MSGGLADGGAGLALAGLLLAWGAQAAIPCRLAVIGRVPRHRGALALLPLLVGGALAAFLVIQHYPDAALTQGLYPLGASILGRVLAVLFAAAALADALVAAGRRSLETAGWRLAAGFGATFLLAATWAAELLRIGEGPVNAPLAFVALVALRALTALGAAEALTPGRPFLAVAAGLALPLYALLLPAPLARPRRPRPVAHPRRRRPAPRRRPLAPPPSAAPPSSAAHCSPASTSARRRT